MVFNSIAAASKIAEDCDVLVWYVNADVPKSFECFIQTHRSRIFVDWFIRVSVYQGRVILEQPFLQQQLD